MHWRSNRFSLLGMVFKRIARMSNDHYRTTYYSKKEAAAIVKRNQSRMTDRGRNIYKARTGVSDYKDAKLLGLTIENYRKLMV